MESTGYLGQELCGKLMPRAGVPCARGLGHNGKCASAAAMERHRRRGLTRVDAPGARQRWSRATRLARYGLSQEKFNQLLRIQENACAMCRESFKEGQRICIDHDHACCPSEMKSCGKCVRGLLCLTCNVALGHIERKYEMARAYLAASKNLVSSVKAGR